MRPSPTFNARGAAIPFTHTKPKAHVGVWSSRCPRCIQLRQEINLRDHARVPAVWASVTRTKSETF